MKQSNSMGLATELRRQGLKNMDREGIQRSESELVVFISSRQDDEMKSYRDEADRTIDAFPLTRPWTFENMPASSESAREYYLRNAAKADYVIWLVGRETTQAVVDEIHICISVHGKLLAFMLPSQSRDEQTNKLIGEVSGYAKWRTVESPDELGEQIKAAIYDESIRGIRDPAPQGRTEYLLGLRKESIARCKQSWIALGVPDDDAAKLSQDRSVGYELSLPTTGVQIVTGDHGAGKTLAVQRLFQSAVDDAMGDSSKPFPIFVRARDLSGSLREYVENVSRGYSFPSVQGTLIVIDGIDEIGTDSANRLLEDVVPYVEANSNVSVVITTRPLPGLKSTGQRVDVPALDEQGVLCLISKVAGRTVERRELWSLTQSIQDVAKLPLFAVIIGAELRKDPYLHLTRPSQLLDRLVQRTLSEAGDHKDEVDGLLQDLAVKAVRGGKSVDKSDVHPRRIVRGRLIDSRLVNEEGGRVDFTLPIFREWFAARALVEGKVSLDELKPVADRWIIPITLAINSEDKDLGRSLVASLARSDPGLASLVLGEPERSWHRDTAGEVPSGTASEIGGEIRQAMKDWGSGLGALMPVIGPVTHDGDISTLGIEVGQQRVWTGWYRGTEHLEPVVRLPKRISAQYDPDWPSLSGSTILRTRTSPWIMTKDMLVKSLSEKLGSRRLALQSADAIRELAYHFACSVKDGGFTTPNLVNVSEVLRYIDEHAARLVSLGTGDAIYLAEDIRIIRRHLEERLMNGEEFISDPWPRPDKARLMDRSRWPWYETFTEHQLLERTKSVYGAALRIYSSMVDNWFQAFDHRLRLRRILPVRLEGRLIVPHPSATGDEWPILDWWARPLSEQEESQVAFELGSRDQASQESTGRMIEAAKPEALESVDEFWYEMTLLRIDGFRPATELAHKWLIDELRKMGWTDELS